MPRDGALRQRERVAQLGHGQLDAIEDGQQAAARGVGEQGQSVKDRGAEGDCFGDRIHPLNPDYRISGREMQIESEAVRKGERRAIRQTPA